MTMSGNSVGAAAAKADLDEFGRQARSSDELELREKLLLRQQSRKRATATANDDDEEQYHDTDSNHRDHAATAESQSPFAPPPLPPPKIQSPARRRPQSPPTRQRHGDAVLVAGNDKVYHGRVVRIEDYGAFVQLDDVGERGLVHISQLAPHRVERVRDVLQLEQPVFVTVLQVVGSDNDRTTTTGGRRLRLSLIGVNQETGQIDTSVAQRHYRQQGEGGLGHNNHHHRGGGGGSMQGRRALERTARQKKESIPHCWMMLNTENGHSAVRPGYLRLVWSSSPEPPAAAVAPTRSTTESKRHKGADKSPDDSDNDSSGDDSSSESESSVDSRRHKRSRRRRDSSRKDRSRRGGGGRRSSRSRRRRRYSSSSSESSDKRLRALLNCDGGALQYDGVTYRINVLKQQEGQQPSTGIGKQQPQLDDTNREMEMVVSHWGKSDVVVRKRKLETETLSRKKPAVEKTIDRAPTNDDDSERAVGKKVEVVHPKEDCHWYLGKQGQPFYLRSCVQDMGSVILDRILDQQKRGPVLYVISGASGIGKSWSINAFATELLRAEKKIFFHSGYDGRAWKINGVGDVEHGVAPGNITALDKEWVYVYDSPGSKETLEQKNTARVRTGPGEVTLIFSSPKAQNYQFAFDKSNGDPRIMNLPTWKKEEMLTVKEKDAEAVDASYGIWGGNMRALDRFIARHTDDRENAKHLALEELDAHIRQIDEVFARKMACKLEKQEVQRQFSGQAVQNSPGHILTPEPTNIDPGESGCFENFRWHFCSPLAEVKFWERLKHMDHGVLKELLISVFKTPSPKGVLFEKVAHVLITNGVVQQFQCYPYKAKHQVRQIKFQECQTPNPISFETDKLEDELGRALLRLRDKAGAVALEPKDTSFDAVDMFVLEKKEGTTETTEDWSLHMIQDTISKTHSFHPLKVLWYCSVFSKVFKEKFQNAEGDPLMCCKYVPVVPGNEKSFAFKKATSDLTWDELDSVEKLLEDFNWHPEFSSKKPNWQAVVKKESLVIPLNANGTVKQLNRKVVGNALLLKHVTETEKVEQMSEVIFNVVSTCENA